MGQEHLGAAQHQKTGLVQREVQPTQNTALSVDVEVHQRVAAKQQVDVGNRRVLDQIVPPEDHRTPEPSVKNQRAVLPREILAAKRFGNRLEAALLVASMSSFVQCFFVEIGSVDLDSSRVLFESERFGQQHRETVRLLASSAGRAPHADRRASGFRCQDTGNRLAGNEVPGFRVAKEGRHVDQDRIEERRELVGIGLQIRRVAIEFLDVHGLHPLLDAPLQARTLVAGEIEAVAVLEEIQQRFELGIFCHEAHRSFF